MASLDKCYRCEHSPRVPNHRYCADCLKSLMKPRPSEACGETFTPPKSYCVELCAACDSEQYASHDREARFMRAIGAER